MQSSSSWYTSCTTLSECASAFVWQVAFQFTARTVGVPGKFPGSVMLETQKFPVSHVEQAPSTKLFMPCVFGGSRGTEYTAYRFLEDTIDSCIARRFVIQRRYLMLHKRSMFALIPLVALVAFFAGCASKTTPIPTPSPHPQPLNGWQQHHRNSIRNGI